MNTHKDLDRFPANIHAEKWIKAGHMRSDDASSAKRKTQTKDSEEEDVMLEEFIDNDNIDMEEDDDFERAYLEASVNVEL